jgi:hypothetical protein
LGHASCPRRSPLAVAAAPATAKIIKAIEMDDQIWEFMEVLFMDNQNRNSD